MIAKASIKHPNQSDLLVPHPSPRVAQSHMLQGKTVQAGSWPRRRTRTSSRYHEGCAPAASWATVTCQKKRAQTTGIAEAHLGSCGAQRHFKITGTGKTTNPKLSPSPSAPREAPQGAGTGF